MSRLSKVLSVDEIYSMTDNGLDIWKKEIEDFSINRNVKNPFKVDKNPSARIKQSKNSNIWLLNVYNDEGGFYTPISFLEKKYGLDFNGVIEYITKNLTLESNIVKKETTKQRNEIIIYHFEEQPFTDEHSRYYLKGGLTEEFLTKEMDIFAVKRYAINKNIKFPKERQFMFAYEFKDITGKPTGKLKFLTLGENVSKKDKWRNNINPTEFFYTYKIKDGDTVFISKSNKDSCITQMLGITSIAALSENRVNIAEGLRKLLPLFPNCKWVLNMGSDKQGFETSYSLSKEFNLQWFNIEKKFLVNGVNDNFAYVEYFGIDSFKQKLKKKGFL